MTQFTKSLFAVELNGKPYLVNLTDESMLSLLNRAAEASPGGALSLTEIPNANMFEAIGIVSTEHPELQALRVLAKPTICFCGKCDACNPNSLLRQAKLAALEALVARAESASSRTVASVLADLARPEFIGDLASHPSRLITVETVVEIAEKNEFPDPDTGNICFDRLGFAHEVARTVASRIMTLAHARATEEARSTAPLPAKTNDAAPPVSCECHACNKISRASSVWPFALTRMIQCTECGNKRCPKASNHTLACTQSNEPGQPGSVY